MVPLIFKMLAKLSCCSNAHTQISEVLAKVEQSCSNAHLSHFMLLTVVHAF